MLHMHLYSTVFLISLKQALHPVTVQYILLVDLLFFVNFQSGTSSLITRSSQILMCLFGIAGSTEAVGRSGGGEDCVHAYFILCLLLI